VLWLVAGADDVGADVVWQQFSNHYYHCENVYSSKYLSSIVSVIHGPPSANHVVKWPTTGVDIASLEPRFVGANKVNHIDARLEVLVGWYVLIVGGRCNIVAEAEAVVAVLEVHIQEALVGTIEGYSSLSHR
jgi:hypothetical protein